MEINETLACKVLTVVDAGLVNGVGEPTPGKMCVEAAVCYAMGLPHGDQPTCVSPALRALKLRLNDSEWSSPATRAAGMRRLAVAQLGSAGVLDDQEFARRCSQIAIRIQVPQALRAAASLFPKTSEHKQALLDAADLCERDGDVSAAYSAADSAARSAAYSAADSAYSAARSAAYSAAASAASAARSAAASAAYSAAYSAASAARSAADSAYSAARSAADSADSAYSAARSAARSARDKFLTAFAEQVVQVLIDMKAPGTAWLYLTEDNK